MRRAPGVAARTGQRAGRGLAAITAATVLGVVLAGCSGSGDEPDESASASSSETRSSSPDDTASEASPEAEGGVPEDVAQGVLDRLGAADGSFGTAPPADPPVLGLEEFNAGAPPEQLAALTERGFVAGAFEQVTVPRAADAVRVVIGFETEAGARADVRSGIEDQPGEGLVKKFDVPGVPGAQGFDVFGQQGLVGRNVAFNVGEYEFILGVATQQPPSKPQVSRAALAAAAKGWYDEARTLG